MNLIKSSYEIWDQSSRFEGMLKHIERAGRVCYKSEGNIKYDECGNSLTAEPFVQKMIKSGHGAMLEHGTVYLKFDLPHSKYGDKMVNYAELFKLRGKYFNNKYIGGIYA